MEGDAPGKILLATDIAAMRILAANKSVRGTRAIRLAGATTTAKATHSWTGRGANYTAWVRALRRDRTSPEAAIHQDAPERVYLAIMNGAKHLLVLHHLHRWKAPNGGRSRLDGCIVAFEGEVRDVNAPPLLWRFDEEEKVLLQLGGTQRQPSIMPLVSNLQATRTTSSTTVGHPIMDKVRPSLMLLPTPNFSGMGNHVPGFPVHGDGILPIGQADANGKKGGANPPLAVLWGDGTGMRFS